jgi:hypothetical protein
MKLEEINLKHNKIYKLGAKYIAKLLRMSSTSLERVNLSENRLTSGGVLIA